MAATIDLVSESQAQKAASVNKNFYAGWPAMTFGLRSAIGLVLNLYGGMWSNEGTPELFDDVALLLDDDSTCYVYFESGSPAAVAFDASLPSNWPGPMSGMDALWLATTAGGAITSLQDLRVMGGASGGGGGGTVSVEDGGVEEVSAASILNFVGNATVVDSGGGRAAIAIPVPLKVIQVACSDQTTDITTGAAKVTFRMPYAMTLSVVRASLSTASSSGAPAIDINKTGVGSLLSTVITIDASENTSTTAATPAVISTSSLSDDDEITIDIDTAGTGAKGLVVTMIGT